MADHNITIAEAETMVDNFKALNISTQLSTFIPKVELLELLNQSGSIGLNIYNGYADGKIHLVVLSAKVSDEAGYEIQDDLSCIKNDFGGDPDISVVPNDINT